MPGQIAGLGRRRWGLVYLGAVAALIMAMGSTSASAGASTQDRPSADDGAGLPGIVHKPSLKRGAWVAKIIYPVRAKPAPASPAPGVILRTTVEGDYHPQELLVLGVRKVLGKTWLRVRLPDRPNSAAGWILESDVRLRPTRWWVRVRKQARTLSVYRNGRPLLRTRVVIGAPATPTPQGLFALLLAAKQPRPSGFLGPWALHLTAHSDVLYDYGGGPGRVAIHGRGGTSLLDPLGSARSHGCIRIGNAVVRKMARWLRPGTPVQVTR